MDGCRRGICQPAVGGAAAQIETSEEVRVAGDHPPRRPAIGDHQAGHNPRRRRPTEAPRDLRSQADFRVEASEHLLQIRETSLHFDQEQCAGLAVIGHRVASAAVAVDIEAHFDLHLKPDLPEHAGHHLLERGMRCVHQPIKPLALPRDLEAEMTAGSRDQSLHRTDGEPADPVPFQPGDRFARYARSSPEVGLAQPRPNPEESHCSSDVLPHGKIFVTTPYCAMTGRLSGAPSTLEDRVRNRAVER